MNNYEVQLRKAGAALETHYYNIIADSLEDAVERVKTEIPNDFGSEYRYELVSCRETARFVLLPKTKAVKAKGAGSR